MVLRGLRGGGPAGCPEGRPKRRSKEPQGRLGCGGCWCRLLPGLPAWRMLLLPLTLLLLAPAARAQHRHGVNAASSQASDSASNPATNPVSSQVTNPASSSRLRRIMQHEMLEPPCANELPLPLRPRYQEYLASRGPRGPRGPARPLALLPVPRATAPRASPRSDSTDLLAPPTRRGYYGHEVGYGSYFPIGLDPLTILAGLAFLAFIIQTLYLLLYKHYGLGLGVSAGIGPLSADRREREQQAWATSLASRIDTTAQTYEASSNSTGSSSSSSPSDAVDSVKQGGSEGRQLGPSPLDALLSMLRRSWTARTCGPSWLCRLMHFARQLTEPLGEQRSTSSLAKPSQ